MNMSHTHKHTRTYMHLYIYIYTCRSLLQAVSHFAGESEFEIVPDRFEIVWGAPIEHSDARQRDDGPAWSHVYICM